MNDILFKMVPCPACFLRGGLGPVRALPGLRVCQGVAGTAGLSPELAVVQAGNAVFSNLGRE